MHNPKPTISVVLDARRAKKSQTKEKLFPIKLRATFALTTKGHKKWIQKYYHVRDSETGQPIYVSKLDFAAIKGGTIRTNALRKIKTEMIDAESRAEGILKSHSVVNMELFERLYEGSGGLQDVTGVFDLKIAELVRDGRIGSRDMYRGVKNSIIKFSGGVSFFEITTDWIRKYAEWLGSHEEVDRNGEKRTVNNSSTTVGIYLRHLRAIYNLAIDKRLINRDLYPFGRGGYAIRNTPARKIALSEADKNRLLSVMDPELRHAVDFWMFSYFCYGLNMTDILLLKVGDLQNDVIMIGREKKKFTDRSGKQLVIPIRKEIKDIILRWGNKTLNPNDYVFPVLTPGLSPSQIKDRTKDFIKSVNAGLKKVGEKLKLDVKLTTYTARHTFATMALRKGASKEFIQDALGHTSMMTTESYLAGFDVDAKRVISEKL